MIIVTSAKRFFLIFFSETERFSERTARQVPFRSEKRSQLWSKSSARVHDTAFAGSLAPSRRKLCFPRVPVGRQFRPEGRKSSPRLRAVYTAVNQLIASPLLFRFSFSLSLLLLASPGRGRGLYGRGVTGRIRSPQRYSLAEHLRVFLSLRLPHLFLIPTTRKSVLLGR